MKIAPGMITCMRLNICIWNRFELNAMYATHTNLRLTIGMLNGMKRREVNYLIISYYFREFIEAMAHRVLRALHMEIIVFFYSSILIQGPTRKVFARRRPIQYCKWLSRAEIG